MSTEHSTPGSRSAGGVFATTHWTAVLTAGSGHPQQAQQALEELCHTYWYPLYAYMRRHGHSREDAEDLTQGFFTRLLEKNFLEGVTVERGKFRAFLLAALKGFMANEWDRSRALKRGGGVAPLSLDWQGADTRYEINPADNLSPDKLYDRAWAMVVLERVVVRLRDEHVADGKSTLYEELRPFLMIGTQDVPYAEAAEKLKMSEGAVRVAVHRLRKRYRELLREEIGQTLANPAQAEEEMRVLVEALSG